MLMSQSVTYSNLCKVQIL